MGNKVLVSFPPTWPGSQSKGFFLRAKSSLVGRSISFTRKILQGERAEV